MEKKKNKVILLIIIGILGIINTIVLIVSGHDGKTILENLFFYIIDIIATIWLMKD